MSEFRVVDLFFLYLHLFLPVSHLNFKLSSPADGFGFICSICKRGINLALLKQRVGVRACPWKDT